MTIQGQYFFVTQDNTFKPKVVNQKIIFLPKERGKVTIPKKPHGHSKFKFHFIYVIHSHSTGWSISYEIFM